MIPELWSPSVTAEAIGAAIARWDVFLAHASPDTPAARRLRELLELRGKDVCFDETALRPGDNWATLLPDYLAASTVTVVLLSAHTDKAWYQQSEVVLAVNAVRAGGHRLISVKLTATAPTPYGLEQLNRLDAFDDPGLVHAADEIADILNHPDRLPPALARPVWSPRIPRVSRWFVGRDAIIEALANGHAIDSTTDHDCGADVVHSGGAPTGGIRVISQTVSGLGGVGKTTVAAAVAERYQSQADIIWWVRAELPTTITDDMCALADRLGIAVGGAPPDRAEAVVTYLASTDRGWLIVFDNAVDERHVAPFIPNAGRGMVLVTTRNRTFNQVGIPFTIGTLPPEVAIEFLQDRVRESNPTAANDPVCAAVAAHLGGLPLALEQAGA